MPSAVEKLSADPPVQGWTAPGFESVLDVFIANFTEDVEVGASFCAIRDGDVVVDLWGGHADPEQTEPWQRDSLVNVYSTTKGIAALAFSLLVQDGLISYDDPVRNYWAELKAGQGGLTVGQLLAHQGGLCGVSEPISVTDLYDWSAMIERLERQEPFWPPGTAAGYHAVVWGYLPGELCLRLTGESLGQLLARRLTEPSAADCYIGLPDDQAHRVVPMIGPNRARRQPDPSDFAGIEMPELYPVALQNPLIRPFRDASSPEWARAEIASSNGHANAKGIATVYSLAAQAGSPASPFEPSTIDALSAQLVGLEQDLVLGRGIRRGAGVILNTDGMFGAGNSFGHSGAGGSTGFADPDAKLAVGYAMNQMQTTLDGDSRAGRLIGALYDAL